MDKKRIHVLDFEVANLIAAGEVVDRPASVIKELLENAIDSGADTVTVEIQHGGVTYMRVTDNGCGIAFDDLPTAILRHATSKITTAHDLDSIGTLGFRGEALAAIASVSKLRIISRPRDCEMGGILASDGGSVIEHSEVGCSVGTSVIVEELFANVPARRKFLKKDASETAAVCTIVERIALSCPHISVRLITDGVMRLRTEGNGDLSSAIYAVLGREFMTRTIPVSADYGSVSIDGFIGMPDTARANRNGQIFFINGRYIHSKTASAALEQAYNTYIPSDRFASCVLSINVSPDSVDVNVHPAKLEVKFSNEKLIFESVYYAVRPALESNMKTNVLKLQDEKKPSYDVDYMRRAERTKSSFVPVRDNTPSPKTIDMTKSVQDDKPQLPHRDAEKTITVSAYDTVKNDAPVVHTDEEIKSGRTEVIASKPTVSDTQGVNVPIPPAAAEQGSEMSVPDYRIIGEAFDCFVIVESENKLLLIDKHAAHERILFERLRANMRTKSENAESQMLLVPTVLQMTPDELSVIDEYSDDIRSAGFEFTISDTEVTITSMPLGFDSAAASEIFDVFADGLRSSAGEARDIILERTLYTCACKAAIKGGRQYGEEHIKWLCDELFRMQDIKYCPHGRPVALELTHAQLDRHFKRIQ